MFFLFDLIANRICGVEASVVPNPQNPESTEFTEAMTSSLINGHTRNTEMKRGARSEFQKGILRATDETE
jgi:hypothetical protein